MEHSMTTTTFTLDGYRIKKHLGVVRGVVVRSRSVVGTLGGWLHTLVGGNITLFTELCENTRAEAFNPSLTLPSEKSIKIGVLPHKKWDAGSIF